MNQRIVSTVTVVVLAILSSSAGQAQTPFYQGKTVRILVGFSPGGAYDLWARLIATHMGKYIAGNPTFVVQNMTGGGSMVAATYVYNVAKPDGLTFAVVTPGLYTEQLFGRKEVQYDWFKLSYVGSPERTTRIFTFARIPPTRRSRICVPRWSHRSVALRALAPRVIIGPSFLQRPSDLSWPLWPAIRVHPTSI